MLPVVCDVSGLRAITKTPMTVHSGVVVTKVLYQVTGNDISISVVINASTGTARTSACQEITVGVMKSGDHRVFYLEPNKATHALGTVTFK